MPGPLTSSFLAAYDPDVAPDTDALEGLLQAIFESAQRAWPDIDVPSTVFAEHLGTVAPASDDVTGALTELRTEDLFLACACLHRIDGAMRAFEQHVLPAAAKAVRRVDPDPSFVEDICSDVRVRLLVSDGEPARIASYLGRGPLVHWVQVTAMRAAQTSKRKKAPRRVDVDMADMALSVLEDDPEVAPLAKQLKQPFQAAFKEALAELTTRERNLLRLYLVEGVSADTIGTMYRVHRATVARWIARARRKVQAGTRKRLSDQEVVGTSSFESVMGHVMTGIDLSLATFLEDTDR